MRVGAVGLLHREAPCRLWVCDQVSEVESNRQGRGSVQDDRGDDIADAPDRPHAGECSIGDTAFFFEGGGLVHVVTGSNDENMIRAEGATCSEV